MVALAQGVLALARSEVSQKQQEFTFILDFILNILNYLIAYTFWIF